MTLIITIKKWSEINGRKDVTNPTWFKFKHKFFYDPEFYDFTNEELVFWLYLLCEASQNNKNGEVPYVKEKMLRMTKISEAGAKNALLKLKRLHIVEVKSSTRRYVSVRDLGARLEGDKKENRKENTLAHLENARVTMNFDFETVYQQYPRKLGKAQGLRKLKGQIKTQEEFDQLSRSIERFLKYHQEKKTEPQFIPYFSTWVSSWRDWADATTGGEVGFANNKQSEDQLWADFRTKVAQEEP